MNFFFASTPIEPVITDEIAAILTQRSQSLVNAREEAGRRARSISRQASTKKILWNRVGLVLASLIVLMILGIYTEKQGLVTSSKAIWDFFKTLGGGFVGLAVGELAAKS